MYKEEQLLNVLPFITSHCGSATGAEVVQCSTHTCHQKATHHLIPKLQVEFYLLLTSAVVTPHKKKLILLFGSVTQERGC